jgi:hypothetical protein
LILQGAWDVRCLAKVDRRFCKPKLGGSNPSPGLRRQVREYLFQPHLIDARFMRELRKGFDHVLSDGLPVVRDGSHVKQCVHQLIPACS